MQIGNATGGTTTEQATQVDVATQNEQPVVAEQPVEVGTSKEYGYRHKTIQRFSISAVINGRRRDFEFKDNILRIKGRNDTETDVLNDAFVQAYSGLPLKDRIQIVQLKEIVNEQPIVSRRVQGVLTSDDIKAPIRSQNVGGAGAAVGPAGSGGDTTKA